MKTITYDLFGGGKKTIEYDETAPCIVCGEPVDEASMGGTAICPSCDCGICRYCGIDLPVGQTEKQTKKKITTHMLRHQAKTLWRLAKEKTKL